MVAYWHVLQKEDNDRVKKCMKQSRYSKISGVCMRACACVSSQ